MRKKNLPLGSARRWFHIQVWLRSLCVESDVGYLHVLMASFHHLKIDQLHLFVVHRPGHQSSSLCFDDMKIFHQ